ncbi:MAG: hypothetical protein JNM78_16360 [Cyclobacteriaceae bacterium]|nr:hypothetical protein [Cyclobacteriaceae bacterium]
MKYVLFVAALFWFSCTGTLSDNQRKKIKEEMENSEIKKVTDAQITQAAFLYGRQVGAIVEKKDRTLTNQIFLDSVSQVFNVEIIALQSENSSLRGVEKQLLEAYQTDAQASDNIQKMGNDSLLYTKPFTREHPDGSTEFTKALGIRMTKKQVILTIN